MAVGARMQTFHQELAGGIAHVAQAPGNQRQGGGRQRLDHALLHFRWHQRDVAVKDGRSHRVDLGLDGNLPVGNRVAHSGIVVTADEDGRRPDGRVAFDRAPDGCIGPPGSNVRIRRGRCIGRRHAPGIDRAGTQPLAQCSSPDGGRSVGKNDLYAPGRGRFGRIAPEKLGGGKLGRKNRSWGWIIDRDLNRLA